MKRIDYEPNTADCSPPMERGKLLELLRLMASAMPTIDDTGVSYYCYVVNNIILDYTLDPELKTRFFDACHNQDFDAAIDTMEEAFNLIFDIEIRDCYDDFSAVAGPRCAVVVH